MITVVRRFRLPSGSSKLVSLHSNGESLLTLALHLVERTLVLRWVVEVVVHLVNCHDGIAICRIFQLYTRGECLEAISICCCCLVSAHSIAMVNHPLSCDFRKSRIESIQFGLVSADLRALDELPLHRMHLSVAMNLLPHFTCHESCCRCLAESTL